MRSHHHEKHFVHRLAWIRAAVLGANDGIISVTSLVAAMAATGVERNIVLASCLAAWIAGAVSMAAGEYVSVKSQQDIEDTDLLLEQKELTHNPEAELVELANIYVHRGLQPELAQMVAQQLTAHNALEAHARDEIGITRQTSARPMLAAVSSALAFSLGALFPLLAILCLPIAAMHQGIILIGVLSLFVLGMISSYLSGTSMFKGAIRITLWGAGAMIASSLIGLIFQVEI